MQEWIMSLEWTDIIVGVVSNIISIVIGISAGISIQKRAQSTVKGNNNTVIQNSTIDRRG